MSGEKTYEMCWDCPYCGAQGLLGKTHRHCPTCGAPQDPERRYFPTPDKRVAVEDHQFVGADRTCPSCSSPNAAQAAHCGNCGAGLDEAKEVAAVAGGAQVEIGDARYESVKGIKDEQKRVKQEARAETWKQRKGKFRAWWLAVVAAIGGAFALPAFCSKPALVEVVGHQWHREVVVEQLRTVDDGAWCESVPSGARNLTQSERVRETRKVKVGEDCREVQRDRGDGTFTVETKCEPRYTEEKVYGRWCAFQIDRWVPKQTLALDGTDQTPRWPEAPAQSCQNLGCERPGARSGTYTVLLKDNKNGQTHRCDYDEARWSQLAKGSLWSVQVNSVTDHARCGSLTPPEAR